MQGAEAAAKARTTVGRRLPGSSARHRGGDEGCCCGWRTPSPHSPYRTRGPDCALALRPVGCSPQFPEVARRARVLNPEGRAGEEVRGPPPAGGRGRGAGPAGPRRRPSLLSRTLRGHHTQAPPPHCPAIFSAPHTQTTPRPSTTAAAALSAFPAAGGKRSHRQAPPPPPSAHSKASPPSPRLHAPPQLGRARAAAALMDPAGCAAPQASAGGDDDRYPNGQSHCHPRDSPAAVVASARTHAQSTLSPLPPFLPSLPFSLASPLTTPSTASQSYRLTPRMRKPLPSSAAFRPYACALTAHPENRINTSARSRQSLTAANPPWAHCACLALHFGSQNGACSLRADSSRRPSPTCSQIPSPRHVGCGETFVSWHILPRCGLQASRITLLLCPPTPGPDLVAPCGALHWPECGLSS